MKTKTIDQDAFWRVHTHNLFNETLVNKDCGILIKPYQILGQILFAVADRARELNDPELNSLMCRLTLYAEADPSGPYYKPDLVDPLLKKYSKKLIKRLTKKD